MTTRIRKLDVQDYSRRNEWVPEILLLKLIANLPVTKQEIYTHLYEVCDNTHASCDDYCPVFYLNNHEVPDTAHDFEVNRGCDTFKDGKKMYEFIQKRVK